MIIDIVYSSSNALDRNYEEGLVQSVSEEEPALMPYQDDKPSQNR